MLSVKLICFAKSNSEVNYEIRFNHIGLGFLFFTDFLSKFAPNKTDKPNSYFKKNQTG